MKNVKLIRLIFSFVLFYSCSNDDDSFSNLPPDNFSLLEITNNETDVSLMPKFTWGRAIDPEGDPVKYTILLSTGGGDPNDILVSDLQTTNFTMNASLQMNTVYKWQVIASDSNGGETKSKIFSFTTRNNQRPENFSLLQVSNNESNIELNPMLVWETAMDPDEDKVTYDVLLDTGNETPNAVIAEGLESTSFQLPNDLDYNTTYSWQVIAYDDQGNSVSSEVFLFTTRMFKETRVVSQAAFSTRTEHSLIEFNGKLWVLGGYHASNGSVNGGLLNDVWSSSDGVNWIEEVPNNSSTSFTPRNHQTVLVFQNKIWVIGGGGTDSLLNDIWSSPDGVNWTQETDNAIFPARYGHTSVVYDDRLWVIGGRDVSSNYLNDVWSSSDGVNWTQETNNAAFTPRGFHSNTAFQGKMWVIGGFGAGHLSDVWSSSDGITWNIETISADFSPRIGHSSVVYKNRIWVIAGDLNNDLWSSKDGITWNQETEIINFSRRGEQANVVFDDKLWIVGGWMGSLLNDVWFFN